jgi:hypothetical protein
MVASAKECWLRLALAFACFATLGFLYVQALAGAAVFGTYSSFAYPWRNIGSDEVMFGLCGASIVLLTAFLHSGSKIQRIAAVVMAALPLLVIAHFFLWLLLK